MATTNFEIKYIYNIIYIQDIFSTLYITHIALMVIWLVYRYVDDLQMKIFYSK